MKIIGLTGGIGTGKSTVSEYLVKMGYKVIDADAISHQVTEKGSPSLDLIREKFGNEFFLQDGSLDRKKMAQLVFNSKRHKDMLEGIVTEEVFSRIRKQLEELSRAETCPTTVFLDVPLLFETGADYMADETWLVTADLDTRIKRVMQRDGISREQVLERVSNQMSCEKKAELADFVIDNSKGKEELYRRVDVLIEENVNKQQ